jgi:hypothetical protein
MLLVAMKDDGILYKAALGKPFKAEEIGVLLR